MLLSEYEHTVDDKGRMFLPAKMREEFGGTVYVTKSVDPCIWVYSEAEWAKFAQKIDMLPRIQGREVRRHLLSAAERVVVDSHGRILLPPRLQEYAGILPGKTVKVLGLGDCAEIWDGDTLEAHRNAEDPQKIADELIKLGF